MQCALKKQNCVILKQMLNMVTTDIEMHTFDSSDVMNKNWVLFSNFIKPWKRRSRGRRQDISEAMVSYCSSCADYLHLSLTCCMTVSCEDCTEPSATRKFNDCHLIEDFPRVRYALIGL
jgi:hypothetical protein